MSRKRNSKNQETLPPNVIDVLRFYAEYFFPGISGDTPLRRSTIEATLLDSTVALQNYCIQHGLISPYSQMTLAYHKRQLYSVTFKDGASEYIYRQSPFPPPTHPYNYKILTDPREPGADTSFQRPPFEQVTQTFAYARLKKLARNVPPPS